MRYKKKKGTAIKQTIVLCKNSVCKSVVKTKTSYQFAEANNHFLPVSDSDLINRLHLQ